MDVGISLPTRLPSGDLADAIEHSRACAMAAAGAGAQVIVVGDRRRSREGAPHVQGLPLIASLVTQRPNVPTVGALVLAPSWPGDLLEEQLESVVGLARAEGKDFLTILALGRPGDEHTPRPRSDRINDLEHLMSRVSTSQALGRLWVAAQSGPALGRAGLGGGGWLAGPSFDEEELARQCDTVREARRAAGHRIDLAMGLRRDVVCRETDREATVVVERLGAAYRDRARRGIVLAGSPETCAERLASFESAGFSHLLIRPLDDDVEGAVESVERFIGYTTSRG